MTSRNEQAVAEVIRRAETQGSVRPPMEALRERVATRQRRKRAGAGALAAFLLVGGGFGIAQILPNDTSEIVAGDATQDSEATAGQESPNGTIAGDEVPAQTDSSEQPGSATEPDQQLSGDVMNARIDGLLVERDRDPLVASARFYATDQSGAALFSGVEGFPFFIVDIRKWLQADGSEGFELRVANRTETGRSGCGVTELGSLAVVEAGDRLEFKKDVFPNVDGVDFLGGDAIACDTYTPISLIHHLEQPFILGSFASSGFILSSAEAGSMTFEKWDDSQPPRSPR